VSWEVAAAWSEHDVGVAPVSGDAVELSVLRLASGLRLASRLRDAPLGAYVHAGVAWREETSDDRAAFRGDDQWGTYAGAGIDWWYSPSAALGPALLHFRGEGELDETWVGLVARFH
jgi:hypothetical protein